MVPGLSCQGSHIHFYWVKEMWACYLIPLDLRFLIFDYSAQAIWGMLIKHVERKKEIRSNRLIHYRILVPQWTNSLETCRILQCNFASTTSWGWRVLFELIKCSGSWHHTVYVLNHSFYLVLFIREHLTREMIQRLSPLLCTQLAIVQFHVFFRKQTQYDT